MEDLENESFLKPPATLLGPNINILSSSFSFFIMNINDALDRQTVAIWLKEDVQ